MEKLPLFKIRCSAIYAIMAGSLGATDKQKERYNELYKRSKDYNKGIAGVKALTANMEAELKELTAKVAEPPQLSTGAKTYVETWLKEQLYSRKKEFTSKQTDKGNIMEDAAIEYASEVFNWGLVTKNTQHFSNDYFTGTPDLPLALTVEDIKNCWDCFTFPLFEDVNTEPRYWWQLQGYMALTGKTRAGLVFVLMDAPEDMVEQEAKRQAWRLTGSGEIPLSLYNEVKASMTYSHLDDELRTKRYEFAYDNEAMLQVVERVKLCRDYIENVLLKKPAIIKLMERYNIAA